MRGVVRLQDWSLRAKLAALLLAASLIPLAVSAYIEIHSTRAQLLASSQATLEARTEQLARELDGIHTNYRRTAERVARVPHTQEYCSAAAARRPAMLEQMQGILEVFPGSDPNIRGVALIDATGRIAVATEAPLVGVDFSNRATVRGVLQGRPVISSLYISTYRTAERPTVAYLAPVIDRSGRVVCAIGFWVNAEIFWRELRNSNRLAGPGSYAVVLDELGIRIGHTRDESAMFHPAGPLAPAVLDTLVNEQRLGPRTRELLSDVRPFPEQYARAISKEVDPSAFRGYSTISESWSSGVGRRLQNVPWTVFYMMPEPVLAEQLARVTRDKIVLIAAIIAIASLAGLAFATSILRPVRALANATGQLAEGDHSVRLEPGGGDEIGKLVESFNAMAERIEHQSRELARSHDDLELRVQQRTAELAQTAAQLQAQMAERQRAEARQLAQLERLSLLDQITRAIGERQDLQSIHEVVLGSLEERMPVDFACICLYDASEQALVVTRLGPRSHDRAGALAMPERTRVPIDQNGLSRAVRGDLVHEPQLDDSPFPFPQRLLGAGLHAMVLAPLQTESRVFGLLVVARENPHTFASADCEFLRQLSSHVALASHQAQLYEALQLAYDELRQTQQAVLQQERLGALGQMASGIAHDINNAISPITLYTEALLEREPGLSERARNHLQVIARSVEDVAATVARMREFYRQREPQVNLAPVDLNELVPQVVDMTRARWSDMPMRGGLVIDLRQELAPDLPAVMGIETEIREALINLVFNAVDAMPQGGTLTLRTRVEGTNGARRVCLEVADTGVGMSEETRRRCLEPFYTTKGERGTGLGLAMVYGAVRRHEADISIDSAPGRGTCVRLSFAVPSLAAVAPALAPAAAPLRRLRILVVDDDPVLLKSLCDALQADGHVVTGAGGGRAGLDLFTPARGSAPAYDVVITDLGMPHVDGREVAMGVKRVSPGTPVIMLTGWGQRLRTEGDMPAHVNQLLSKPPKMRELREALAQCVATAAEKSA